MNIKFHACASNLNIQAGYHFPLVKVLYAKPNKFIQFMQLYFDNLFQLLQDRRVIQC